MANPFKTSHARLKQVLFQVGGLFGFAVLALSFFDWLQDSLALG